MNCGLKLVKYLLVLFNVIFMVFAFVLIGVGATVEIKYRHVVQVTEGAISTAPILLLCIGIFILFVSLLGCIGAYKESYCLIMIFAVVMGLMFILELATVGTAYTLREKIETYLESSFGAVIEKYSMYSKNPLDFIQTQFQCCGAFNSSDWNQNSTFTVEVDRLNLSDTDFAYVPDSCCLTPSFQCGLKMNSSKYSQGCIQAIEESFKRNIGTVGGTALAIIFIQMFGLSFAGIMVRTIASQYETV